MTVWNNRGFTLLETLLTLFVVVMLVGLPSFIGSQVLEKMESILFLEDFQSHLLAIQNYALLMNEKTEMKIQKSGEV
ncbi:prepilin-type N-terminal cleavage/methylation domain-containing protein [Carnobacterium gallinarum]|uniref:prepilin-type N-terminal cleavage/methylation domain-containing protein n=1 Tax=Carnobacterium gallinarum TaxID=2749 RepID=UPI00068A6FCC|nr:prepilin-type N-terminal cleavage/methylation domain-containing protein [Carnobacterium gallinarum]